jgi:hypothetical protein
MGIKLIAHFIFSLILASLLYADPPSQQTCVAPLTILKSTKLTISEIVVIKDGGSIALMLSGSDNNKFLLIAKRPGRLGIPKEAEQVFDLCDISQNPKIDQIPTTVIKGSALEAKLIKLLIELRDNLGADSKKYQPRIDGFINMLKDRNIPWPP